MSVRRAIAFAVFAFALTWALWLILGGGFDLTIAGRRLRSSDPVRPLIIAAVAFLAYAALTGTQSIVTAWSKWFDRAGDARLALLITAAVIIIGIANSVTVGIASDGYGYVSQADLWIRGNLFIPEPHIGDAPWPRPEWTFAPLGYRPVLVNGAWCFVPIYSAGLPMMMALAKAIGGQERMYWVVPAFGGLLAWMTFAIGRHLGSSRAGLIACWLVATSPVLLLMIVQPMSDVPVAAAWATAIFLALGRGLPSAALCGLASSLAILIRPNLAGLAGVLWFWWLARPSVTGEERRWRSRLQPALVFTACVLPGVLITAALYQRLYGLPFSSGYGNLGEIFSWNHVLPNLRLYLGWFFQTHSRLLVFGLLALLLPVRALWPWVNSRAALWMILGCVALTVLQYLAYLEFDHWSFLRYLLVCSPFVMLGVAAVALMFLKSPRPMVPLAVTALVLMFGVQGLQYARTSQIFKLWQQHRRSVDFAHVVARELPASSVFYALNHSGTLRHYAGRTTVRIDFIEPDWLDRSVAWFDAQGLPIYLVLEDWEVDVFKSRFPNQATTATLDDRLAFVYATEHPYRVYQLTGRIPAAPKVIETADLHQLRSALPDPGAFAPQLTVLR